MTVGAWVKKNSNPDGKIAIVQKSDNSYILRLDNNEPQFVIDPEPGTKIEAKAGFQVTLGEWYHLVGTYDGTDVKIYVDGELESNKATSVPMGSGSLYGLGIGKNLDKGDRYLNGEIEHITIWDRALTADQVLDYYNQTSHKP